MDIANQKGGLVIGTGDLSELALGWATYNGDHMSMYAVNASVPKTLVRHLVAFVSDDKRADQPKLSAVLEAGRNAPTAHNLQPQRIFVLQSSEALEKVDGCTGAHFHPPVMLLVADRLSKKLAVILRKFRTTMDDRTQIAYDAIQGIAIGKSYNLYHVMCARINAAIDKIADHGCKSTCLLYTSPSPRDTR